MALDAESQSFEEVHVLNKHLAYCTTLYISSWPEASSGVPDLLPRPVPNSHAGSLGSVISATEKQDGQCNTVVRSRRRDG